MIFMSSVQVSCVIFIAGDDDSPKKETEKIAADSMKLRKEGNDTRTACITMKQFSNRNQDLAKLIAMVFRFWLGMIVLLM